MAGLRARRRVGSVTSLATSATICSYPEVLDSNKKFEVREHEKTAALARSLDATVYEIPTAVGNCMLINRAALNDVGLFDDEIFAKGYGEENDFSRRCVQRGWVNVCAPKCFTTHFGEVSFGGAVRGPRVEQAGKKINLLHPDYNKVVHDYIAHDPLSKVRRELDIARIAGEVCGSVFITHGIGGGIETYVDLKKGNNNTWVLTGYRDGRTTLTPGLAPHRFPNLQFGAHERDLLVAALRRLNPARFEVQSLVSMPWQISSVIDEVGKPHGVIAHDFAMYCHQVSCMDSGEYCGNEDADLDRCTGCLSRNQSVIDFPKTWTLAQWRKDAELLVKNADYVVAPSEDTANRYRRVFDIKVDVKRHTDDKYRAAELAPLKDGERLRIAVIGAIGPHKGYHPVLEMTEIAHAKQAPVDFYVVGYTMDDPRLLKHGNAFITGAYKDEEEAKWLLSSIKPHVVLYMPKFPETWCYTLDIIRSAGLFVVSHDLGALGERLRGKPGSKVLPMNTSALDTLQAIFGLWGRSIDAGQETLAIAA